MPSLPIISGADVIRALQRLGFVVVRQRGSHVVLRNGANGCVVPDHRELKTGTLASALKQAGITADEFLTALHRRIRETPSTYSPSMIRIATAADSAAIHAIYAPCVLDSVITFETELPGIAAMQARIEGRMQTHPWLVWDEGGKVLAYAYAMRYRERAAYDWIAETSIYVHADARRRGLGVRIYRCLLDVLRLQGFTQAVGVITLPGLPSIALHDALGFTPAGVWRKAGYKLGAWHDVAVAQRELQPSPVPAIPVIPFAALRDDPELTALLFAAGND